MFITSLSRIRDKPFGRYFIVKKECSFHWFFYCNMYLSLLPINSALNKTCFINTLNDVLGLRKICKSDITQNVRNVLRNTDCTHRPFRIKHTLTYEYRAIYINFLHPTYLMVDRTLTWFFLLLIKRILVLGINKVGQCFSYRIRCNW